jgi:hypothetical protein
MLETITGNTRSESVFLTTPRSMMPGSWACDSPRVLLEPLKKEMPTGKHKDASLSLQIPNFDENTPCKAEERDAAESTAREDESPAYTETSGPNQFECDYDINPTEIFLQLQRKEWDAAVKRADEVVLEARTWVSRKEKHGKLRWRLLPVHAAIIFKAPENVIETLLAAYPKGAQSKDDQGMLPLHLAFRHGSTEGTVNLLLVAFPQSVNCKDRKGRIPLVLAQASASPNREAFVRALERGPSYYANAAAATERASVTAEQRAIFDAKLTEVEKKHQQDVNELKEERKDLKETVENLQKELAKQKGTTQVLVDHVNSLEAQLKCKGETERFLAVKAATLETNLRETNQDSESMGQALEAEIARIQKENEGLRNELDQAKKGLHATVDVQQMKEKSSRHEKELKALKMDWASAQARAAVLEAQLKTKIETEHQLASQVSHLAAKLAEAATESGNTGTMYARRIEVLEEEREQLRAAVNDLGKKLLKVSHFMNKITLKNAEAAKRSNEGSRLKQAKLVEDATNHEKLIRDALEDRKHMAELLKKQEEEMEKSARQHQEILEKIEQLKNSENLDDSDDDEIPFTNSLAEEMHEMMNQVMMGMPVSTDDSEIYNNIMETVVPSNSNKQGTKHVRLPGLTFDDVLQSSSSDIEEDPQKCLEEALKALELSRTKSLVSDEQYKSMSEVSASEDGGTSVNFNPSDEESDFKRVQKIASGSSDDDDEEES